MALEIVSGSEAKQAISKDKLLVVNIFATWCGPCQMFAPILEKVANKQHVVKVDLDQNREFAAEYNVRSVPTTFIFKNQKIVETLVGFVSEEVLQEHLQKVA